LYHFSKSARAVAAAAGAVALCTSIALAQADVSVTLNGSPLNLNPAPQERAGRVFVPLRGVFEQLGASVVYENGTINAQGRGNRSVSLHIGSTASRKRWTSRRSSSAPAPTFRCASFRKRSARA
jgi:hypothetical protein